MKSIYHGTAEALPLANAKLRGKKTCVLSCQCCSAALLMNIKDAERDKEADRDIQEFINNQHRLDPDIEDALSDNLWELYARE